MLLVPWVVVAVSQAPEQPNTARCMVIGNVLAWMPTVRYPYGKAPSQVAQRDSKKQSQL
jgi:hypothetical protein